MIVEDDASILNTLADVLTEEGGFQVSLARNGEEALALLTISENLPDLILLDLMMPKKNGAQFREEQETHPRLCHIPVILMSADSQVELKTLQVGIRAHLRKPFDIEEVLRTVKSLCA